MKPSLQQKLEQDPRQSIDLSPLIDVVFILLIFFIVTTAFIKETGIKVEKPKAVTAQKLENELILLAVTPAGEVIYDHTNVGVSGVRSTVSALMTIKARPVVIQADRKVTTDLLVRVMDEAKLGGAESISIGTVAAQ
jgi:biopolymer transport protein ExbD